MEIEINEKYVIYHDKLQWVLVEKGQRFNKKKEQWVETQHKTYHATLFQACNAILDREPRGCENAQMVVDTVVRSKQQILDALEKED